MSEFETETVSLKQYTVNAFLNYTRRAIALDDGEYAVLSQNSYTVRSLRDGDERRKPERAVADVGGTLGEASSAEAQLRSRRVREPRAVVGEPERELGRDRHDRRQQAEDAVGVFGHAR